MKFNRLFTEERNMTTRIDYVTLSRADRVNLNVIANGSRKDIRNMQECHIDYSLVTEFS